MGIVLFKNKKTCCGCGACASICPKEAISMKPDNQGFIYPVIDSDLCVSCGAYLSFTLIAKTLNPNTWVSFVLTAILCGVIGCIIHLVFVFSRDEKSRILVIIKSKEK